MKGKDLPPMVYYFCENHLLAKRGEVKEEYDIYHLLLSGEWDRLYPGKPERNHWHHFMTDIWMQGDILSAEQMEAEGYPMIEEIFEDETVKIYDRLREWNGKILKEVQDAKENGELIVSEKEMNEEFIYYKDIGLSGCPSAYFAKKGEPKEERDIYFFNGNLDEWEVLHEIVCQERWIDAFAKIRLGNLAGVKEVLFEELKRVNIPLLEKNVVDMTSRIKEACKKHGDNMKSDRF